MRIEEIEDYGFFWLPEDQNAQHRMPGILRVSVTGAVTLETFGFLDPTPHSLSVLGMLNQSANIPTIVGYTRSQGMVTLEDCINTRANIQSPNMSTAFSTCEFRATVLIVGVHVFAGATVRFNRVVVDIEGMDTFLQKSGIVASDEPGRKGTTVQFDVPEPIDFDLGDGLTGRIGFAWSVPITYSATSEVRLFQRAHFELLSTKGWKVGEISQKVMWLRSFLCLATDRLVSTTSIVAYSPDIIETDERNSARELPIKVIYETSGHHPEEQSVNGPEMAFSFPDIKDNFSDMLGKWFSMYLDLRRPLRLYFDAQYSREVEPADRRLLTLTEALQSLDRTKGGGRWSELPTRVTRLAKEFGEVLGDEEAISSFARAVGSTRHYLVHHEEAHREGAAMGANLFALNSRIEVLLLLHFVAGITGDAKSAVELVGKSQPVLRRMAGRH